MPMKEQRERRRSNGGNGNGGGHGTWQQHNNNSNLLQFGKVASASSMDQMQPPQHANGNNNEHEWLSQDELICSSDELDKLSMCLSEASSENQDRRRPSLLSDIVQAQLALWTLVITVFYSYAWQQHRKKFLLSLFVVVPPVLLLICTLSSLLTAIVILGRLFSTPLRFGDILRVDDGVMDESEGGSGSSGRFGSLGSGGAIRRRTASGTSCQSCGSVSRGLSISCEELPKPVCRKHSTNGSQLSLYGNGAGGNGGNGGSNGGGGSANGGPYLVGGGGAGGLVARSESIGSGGQLQRHQFAHFPSDGSQLQPQQ